MITNFKIKVYLKGSHKQIERTLIAIDGKHYIKWFGNMVEVMNAYGIANTASGWRTVKEY